MHVFLAYPVRYARRLYSKKQKLFGAIDKTVAIGCIGRGLFLRRYRYIRKIGHKEVLSQAGTHELRVRRWSVASVSIQLKAHKLFAWWKPYTWTNYFGQCLKGRSLRQPRRYLQGLEPWHWRHNAGGIPRSTSGPRSVHTSTLQCRESIPQKKTAVEGNYVIMPISQLFIMRKIADFLQLFTCNSWGLLIDLHRCMV